MSIALPIEINYKKSLPTLPGGCQTYEQYLQPVNGPTFSCATAGTTVAWDLPCRSNSFLVPNSMYIRYKGTVTSTAAASMLGTPVYTPIQKCETIFGSQVVESINNYNQAMNMMTQLSMTVADKYGYQNSYGWYDNGGALLPGVGDGRYCATNDSNMYAAPLFNILSNSTQFVPLGLMQNVRVQLTLDSIANMFDSVASVTGYTISNFELCFTVIDMGEQVNAIVKGDGEKFYIKSQSIASSSSSIPVGTTGNIELVYSQRLASIKSLFLASTAANAVNKNFDCLDITNSGSYSFTIAGKQYPPKPIDCAGNKTGAYMELKKAVGSISNNNTSFSINTVEFGRTGNNANATTVLEPGKFIVGVNTELLPQSRNVLLTGTSTQNSPVTARLFINTATTNLSTPTLFCLYDALIEIDPILKNATVKQ